MISPKRILGIFILILLNVIFSVSLVHLHQRAMGVNQGSEGLFNQRMVQAEESGEGVLDSGPPSSWLEGKKRDDPSRLLDRFSHLDANHDGYIDFEEWNGSRASFNQMDNNGDGLIDRGELLGLGGTTRE